MANSTDPFGKSLFGGETPTGSGMVSMATQPTTAAAQPAAYKYAGQGWNDPLAQQMYQKYAFGGRLDMPFVQSLARRGDSQAGHGGNYHNPLDPKEWGGTYQGDEANQMIDAYKAAGGQGLYSQQAATNPSAVGWPTDAAGNPLPRAGASGPEYPQASGEWSSTLTSAGQPAGGSGSMHSLSPEVLKKMWRT